MNNLEELIYYYNNQQNIFNNYPKIIKLFFTEDNQFENSNEEVNEESIKQYLKQMIFQNSNLFINYTNAYFKNRLIDLIDEKTNFEYSSELEKSPINSNFILKICQESNLRLFEDIIKILI